MSLKQIDPKIVASRATLAAAGVALIALMWWARDTVHYAEKLQDPVQNVIASQGLLDN